MLRLREDLLGRFQELIYGQSALSFSPSRLVNLENGINQRIRERQLCSYEEYFTLLQKDIDEFDALLEMITTKETHFFRLPAQFEALARKVVPAVEEELSFEARRVMVEEGGTWPWRIPLRAWSAGCSTGEEAYSIAMTVMNSLKFPRAWKTEILATDISRKALTTASLGFYEENAIKRVPRHYRKHYLKLVSGGAVVKSEVVDKVDFRLFNLKGLEPENVSTLTALDDTRENVSFKERFDIIFCRNVMIYFDYPAQQRMVDRIYAGLKPGGFLFTGDAELLNIYRHGFENCEFEGAYYYRKPKQ